VGAAGAASAAGATPQYAPSNADHASASATSAIGDPSAAARHAAEGGTGAADDYLDPPPTGDPPDEWGSELLDAEPMTRTLSYGEIDAKRRPRPPRVDGGRKGSDDPDPLPPVQDPPEGVM
jgi:hypothetical protein